MRRIVSLLAATMALLLIVPTASANNDPHRYPVPDGYTLSVPADICGFPVQITYTGNAYERDTADTVTVTGLAILSLRNLDSEKSIDVRASGPARLTFSVDGSWVQFSRGLGTLFDPALTSFGFPSDFVLLAGGVSISYSPEGAIVGISGNPRVVMDVCARLS